MKEEYKSVRQFALDDGITERVAQRMARAYQNRYGGLIETVHGYRITRVQWELVKHENGRA